MPESTSLSLGFLGHQSWRVFAGDVHVLIDPVLGDTLGHTTRMAVHPPRDIDLDALPAVDLVVLTHAHNDHVDLASLARLPPETPVLVAPLMPEVVVQAIRRLGLPVHRGTPGLPLTAGPLTLTLLPGAARAPVAEGRVAQVLVSVPAEPAPLCVLFGVDTPIAAATRALVSAGELPVPDAVVVANNTQIPPLGVVGSGRNLLQPDPAAGFVGLELLRELCVDFVAGLPGPPAVILCGGGFLDTHELESPYAYDDHSTLAALARQLSGGRAIHGPMPGQVLTLSRDAAGGCQLTERDDPLVQRRDDELDRRRQGAAKAGPLPLRSVLDDLSPSDWAASLRRVEASLDAGVPQLLAHPLGQAIVGCHWWRHRWLGGQRLLLRLVGGPDGKDAWRALDLPSGRFVSVDKPDVNDLLNDWPFGMEIFLQDLDALLRGHLAVWDILGVALRHWSPPGPSIPAFLCLALDESVRVDGAAVRLAATLCALGHPTSPQQLLHPRKEAPFDGESVD